MESSPPFNFMGRELDEFDIGRMEDGICCTVDERIAPFEATDTREF